MCKREDIYGIGRAAEALSLAACVCLCMFLFYQCGVDKENYRQTQAALEAKETE